MIHQDVVELSHSIKSKRASKHTIMALEEACMITLFELDSHRFLRQNFTMNLFDFGVVDFEFIYIFHCLHSI